MNAAAVSNAIPSQSQTGLLMLAFFLLGLSIMAWLTVREASLYENKTAIKNLRRSRKVRFPESEKISFLDHLKLFYRNTLRGGDIVDPFYKAIGEGEYGFEFRLRREIDKLVGKDVYHGQKEQL